MKSVTVFGSINYDLVTIARRVPNEGETVHAVGFETHHGGKGANQAVAVRRLTPLGDVEVRMIGRVGSDAFGRELVDGLAKESINVSQVSTHKDEPTGVATIIVDEKSAQNRILVYSGANGTFTVPEVESNSAIYSTDAIILQNEIPLDVVYALLRQSHANGILTVYNPSPMPEDLSELSQALQHVSHLIVNSTEAQDLARSHSAVDDDADKASAVILELAQTFTCHCIVITLGANGCVFYERGPSSPQYIPAVKVDKAVDTTGAGDTFLGAFVGQVVVGKDVSTAVSFAVKCAAITVTRPGAASSIPHLSELE